MADMSLPKIAADHNRISFGLTLMVISVLLSPLIDIFAKLAIATVPSAEITAVRFLLQVVFILPIVLVRGSLFDLTWKKTGLHALRGGLLALVYALGLGIPFIVAGLAFTRLAGALAWVKRHHVAIQRTGGVLMIIVGIMLVTGWWDAAMAAMRGWVSSFEVVI